MTNRLKSFGKLDRRGVQKQGRLAVNPGGVTSSFSAETLRFLLVLYSQPTRVALQQISDVPSGWLL
jgi:hypothetical protein